jgi:hypothetical protein
MLKQIESILNERKGQPGIIYCSKRKDVDKISEYFNQRGYKIFLIMPVFLIKNAQRIKTALRQKKLISWSRRLLLAWVLTGRIYAL